MLTLLLILMSVSASASQDPTIELLEADRRLALVSQDQGFALAIEAALAADPTVLLPGAPVLRGGPAVKKALGRATAGSDLTVTWTAKAGWVSLDGGLGVTAGQMTGTGRKDASLRHGNYIAAWIREDGGFRLSALMISGVGPTVSYDSTWGPAALTDLSPSGPTEGIVATDLEFSARAGTEGPASAFRGFSAPDAVIFGATDTRRGPEAISEAIGRGDPADWSWAPVAAVIAPTGDLGYTVGQAVIAPKSGGPPLRSKYLTVWRRQPDGAFRFLTDGGNARPAR